MDFIKPGILEHYHFPDFKEATSFGLLAVGGDLQPYRLIKAYSEGIFPWFDPADDIHWWIGRFRPIYIPGHIHLGKNLRKAILRNQYRVVFDYNPMQVLENCGKVNRKGQDSTWISDDIKAAYYQLYRFGILHSIEVYRENEMVGGLYGLSMGKAFFGESMFHTEAECSKIALFALSEFLFENQFYFIDSQVSNPHSYRMGAHEISFKRFYKFLKIAVNEPTLRGQWEYNLEPLPQRLKMAMNRKFESEIF